MFRFSDVRSHLPWWESNKKLSIPENLSVNSQSGAGIKYLVEIPLTNNFIKEENVNSYPVIWLFLNCSGRISNMAIGIERRRRRVILAISVIAVITIIVVLVRSCSNDSDVEYVFGKINKGEVTNTVYVSGKLDVNTILYAKSEIYGEMKKIYVKVNSNVKKGSLLAVINSPDLDYEYKQLLETYRQQKMSEDAVKDTLESKEKMFKDALISQKEYQNAQRDYERTISVLRQTTYRMDVLKQNIASKYVRSPVSGQVLQIFATETFPVSKGMNLMQIVPDMKKLLLTLNIDESDIGVVSSGKTVEFNVTAYPNKVFKGTVTGISSVPVASGGGVTTYQAWAECDNSSLLLKPGMSVTASIFITKKDNVLCIPNEALTITPVFTEMVPGKRFVWKKAASLSDGDYNGMTRVEVKTGIAGNSFTEYVSGQIKEGDEVLIKIKKVTKKGKSIPGI